MTEKEAKEKIKYWLGNDYWFLPEWAERKWIKELIENDDSN